MVIAFDFDGTVATDGWPDISKAKPNRAVIDWLKKRAQMGDKLILWTCRENYGGVRFPDGPYLENAQAFCAYHLLFPDEEEAGEGRRLRDQVWPQGDRQLLPGRRIRAVRPERAPRMAVVAPLPETCRLETVQMPAKRVVYPLFTGGIDMRQKNRYIALAASSIASYFQQLVREVHVPLTSSPVLKFV